MVWCGLSIDRHITWFTYQNRFCHSWVVTACCFRSLFTVGLSSCHLSSNCTPGRLEFKSKVDIFSTFSFNPRMISWQEHSIPFENIPHTVISQAHILLERNARNRGVATFFNVAARMSLVAWVEPRYRELDCLRRSLHFMEKLLENLKPFSENTKRNQDSSACMLQGRGSMRGRCKKGRG